MVFMLVNYLLDVLFMLMTLHCYLPRVTGCKNFLMPAHIMEQNRILNLIHSSLLIAFGSNNPSSCEISLNGNQISWVTSVKYIGLQFLCNSGNINVSDVCRKF